MPTLTIRDLEPTVKERLRVRAARNGRSMEEEARAILRHATRENAGPQHGLGSAIHELFASVGGVEFEVPRREPSPPPIKFK